LEAIALVFSKFSEELIAAQMAVLCLTGSLATYWLLIRKKKKESAEWVPAALVRAYLDRVRNEERDIRLQLFGEDSRLAAGTAGATVTQILSSPDPALLGEVAALRAQLTASDARVVEFDRLMSSLRTEKAALEQKLKDMPAGSAGGADSAGLRKEIEDLKGRLQEYEVIEDDLANLKKFQKENEALRLKVETLEKAPAPAPVVIAAAPAPESEPVAVIAGGEHAAPAMTLVNGGAEASAPASEVNTNVLETVQPGFDTPAAAAPEKSAKQKEEELLSEFEKMLAS